MTIIDYDNYDEQYEVYFRCPICCDSLETLRSNTSLQYCSACATSSRLVPIPATELWSINSPEVILAHNGRPILGRGWL